MIAVRPTSDFRLEDYAGRALVLNFWATWCGPCRQEIADLVQLRSEYDEKDLAIIGVSVDNRGRDESVTAARDRVVTFARRLGINYSLMLDEDLALVETFGGFNDVPTTFIIDTTGRTRQTFSGAASLADLRTSLVGVMQTQDEEPLNASPSKDEISPATRESGT